MQSILANPKHPLHSTVSGQKEQPQQRSAMNALEDRALQAILHPLNQQTLQLFIAPPLARASRRACTDPHTQLHSLIYIII